MINRFKCWMGWHDEEQQTVKVTYHMLGGMFTGEMLETLNNALRLYPQLRPMWKCKHCGKERIL